jgi:phosphate uptake regulator
MGMDIRKVQKTGNMHYIYLPTSWCKKNRLFAGSNVTLSQLDNSCLTVEPKISEKSKKSLSIRLAENDPDILQKIIIACYINPLASFNISLDKEMDYTALLTQKMLISLDSVEFDKNIVKCESAPSINDPLSLLKTMVRKVRNLGGMLSENCSPELAARYEDEIDRTKLMIEKSILSFFTFNSLSRHRTIDLHYISLLSKDLEWLADYIPRLCQKDPDSLKQVLAGLDCLQEMLESQGGINYRNAIEFIKKSRLPGKSANNLAGACNSAKGSRTSAAEDYLKRRVSSLLRSISEVLIDWAITNEAEIK